MDSSLPDNRSNLLVYAVGIAAVIALVLGIVSLARLSKISRQLGDVTVADIAARMDAVESSAKKAADDAAKASTRIAGLNTDTKRAFDDMTNYVAGIKAGVDKLGADTKALTERINEMGSGGVRPTTSGSGGTATGSGGTAGPAPGTLSEDGTYVIKQGDTLGAISRQFGTTVSEIERANPGIDPNRLRIGQRIVIPRKQ